MEPSGSEHALQASEIDAAQAAKRMSKPEIRVFTPFRPAAGNDAITVELNRKVAGATSR